MSDDKIDKKIREMLGYLPGKFNLIESQIDIDLQMKYFERSKEIKTDIDEKEVLETAFLLYLDDVAIQEKKDLLIKLASIDKPEAYRAIEKYKNESEGELHDWALIALHDCRMLLESTYLEEPQVFISTGLGGKNNLLRYFVVFFTRDDKDFSEVQQKVLNNELKMCLSGKEFEVEALGFHKNFGKLTILLPVSFDIPEFFQQVIRECNIYGNFVNNRCLITNVKVLDDEEIGDYYTKLKEMDTGGNSIESI
ncbi:MAG: hypothetical protein ABIJ16_06955 [Bacteroidota bacterium]